VCSEKKGTFDGYFVQCVVEGKEEKVGSFAEEDTSFFSGSIPNIMRRIISDFHLFIAARLLDVTDTVDGHVILGDEGGDFQLIHVDDVVQIFDTGDRVDFVFNGRGHERQEPPSHDLFFNGERLIKM
jgi:hypothetical protein